MFVSKIGVNNNFSYHNFLGEKQSVESDSAPNKNMMITKSIPLETFKAYNAISDNNKLNIQELTIVLSENPSESYLCIEKIINEDDIEAPKELKKIYDLAINNQFVNSKTYKEGVDGNFYEFTEDYSFLKLLGEENLPEILKNLKNDFAPNKIEDKYIEEAFELAPYALCIDSKKANIRLRDRDDEQLSCEEYKNKVSKITPQDVADYHDKVKQNSSHNMTLVLNNTFYQKNKDLIGEILKKDCKFESSKFV